MIFKRFLLADYEWMFPYELRNQLGYSYSIFQSKRDHPSSPRADFLVDITWRESYSQEVPYIRIDFNSEVMYKKFIWDREFDTSELYRGL